MSRNSVLRGEFDLYIPPDVQVQDDGSIQNEDYDKLYRFHNLTDKFLLSFTGEGMPPIEYINQSGPFQHGETLIDYRLQRRIIQLIHRSNGDPCERRTGYWSIRGEILNALRPNRQRVNEFCLGRLRKEFPDGSTRDIDVIVQQGPIFAPRNLGQWDEWSFTETIRFIAPDPTFYDPEEQSLDFTLPSFAGLIFYEDPDYDDHLTFPIVFGADAISGTATITYTGTWLTYPEIVITGPLNNPLIENTTTDEKIELDYDVPTGQTVTIRLPYGNKTVIDSTGVNRIGTVTTDSDLATFHIAPDPEAPDGINVIEAGGDGGLLGSSQITIRYFTRYIGI